VTLAVPADVMPLFRTAFLCRDIAVVDLEGDLPAHGPDAADYHSPIGSYLRHLDLQLPPEKFRSYIDVPPAELAKPAGTKLTIGLVWAPRPLGEISIRRNIALGELLSLAEIPGVALYSLQVGPHAKDLERRDAGVLVTDLSRRLRDWNDTASHMAALDLIISIDSAPLHLAGAMRRPVIGLLPFVSCWRWGARDTDRTPWYPSMRLLRQSAVGDWSAVVHQLHQVVTNHLACPDRELLEIKQWLSPTST
jgi:hypothetical protein